MAVTVLVTPPLYRKAAVAPDALRRCTAMPVVVNNGRGGALPQTTLLGHGQVVTAIGVVVQQTRGGGAS